MPSPTPESEDAQYERDQDRVGDGAKRMRRLVITGSLPEPGDADDNDLTGVLIREPAAGRWLR
jgi:hypothetical protein